MPPTSKKQQKFMASQKPEVFEKWRSEGKAKVEKDTKQAPGKCPHCGASLAKGDTNCPTCGKPLKSSENPFAKGQKPQDQKSAKTTKQKPTEGQKTGKKKPRKAYGKNTSLYALRRAQSARKKVHPKR